MRDHVVSICATSAFSTGERLVEKGTPERDVMVEVMRSARLCFLAPDDGEAFAAGIAALMRIYPEKKQLLLDEAKAIGDRGKLLSALMNDVPVDLDRAAVAPVPEDAVGLVELFEEASR